MEKADLDRHWQELSVDDAAKQYRAFWTLVAGRERIYLDRFYNELSAHPEKIDEATRGHYAMMYAKPHAMHDAFEQFKAFAQDGVDNRGFRAKGKLAMPVLALGGEKSYGTKMKIELDDVASNVQGGVIPESGHWIMEENPQGTAKLVLDFLK